MAGEASTPSTARSGASQSPLDQPLRILEAVRSKRAEWIDCLTSLASIESPTADPSAQKPVQDFLAQSLRDLGFRVRHLRGSSSGGTIVGTPTHRYSDGFQLLLGHTDTVWPTGTLAGMPVEVVGPILRGPGVFDMKAGLTHVVIALSVLRDLELEPAVAPVVMFNSDEETGSRDSARQIRRLGRRALRVLVLEPALGLDGKIKTARKGVGQFTIRVIGQAAHAGLDPGEGASAILELSFMIQSLHRLSDLERGISVNVGEIRGGLRPNVVAPEARAEVDVRVESLEQAQWIENQIRGLETRVPGCRVEIDGGLQRPPMERTTRNQSLWREAHRLGLALGVELADGIAGGGSDGNTTSIDTATLDGLGAVGDGAHAAHEHVDIDRSLERCALLAALVLLPAKLPHPASEP